MPHAGQGCPAFCRATRAIPPSRSLCNSLFFIGSGETVCSSVVMGMPKDMGAARGIMYFSALLPLYLYSRCLICRFLKGIMLPSPGLKDSFNEFDEAVEQASTGAHLSK